MRLPWKRREELEQKKEEIEDLESRVEKLEEEKQKWRNRFEAEKERRSELSRKKQEAEEELNRLKQPEGRDAIEEGGDEDSSVEKFQELDLRQFRSALERLESVESGRKDLVTVQSPGGLEELSDLRELKNSVSGRVYRELSGEESFVAFIDPVLGAFVFKLAPFFSEKVFVGEEFDTNNLISFIESEKHWCLVSAGETEIYREKRGEYELVESVKSRVDREHSKGGFSQDRFERKREEQVSSHLEDVRDEIGNFENIYLMGDARLCDKLPGEYLGGFDPNRKKPEQFYRCRFGIYF